MQYLILIADDETTHPEPGSADFDAWMEAWASFNALLTSGGHLLVGAGLQPTRSATTVRKTHGSASQLVDGPFAETKEQLGGFYLVEAADLDEALALAGRLPIHTGSVEVRPLSFRVAT